MQVDESFTFLAAVCECLLKAATDAAVECLGSPLRAKDRITLELDPINE
jgi:hypothetical protein